MPKNIHKKAEDNILFIAQTDSIDITASNNQQNDKHSIFQETDSSKTNYSTRFYLPKALSGLIPVGFFMSNLTFTNGQTCYNFTMIPTQGFYGEIPNGACYNDTYMNWDGDGPNRSWVPPFNLAVNFASNSFTFIDKISRLFGMYPSYKQPGACGVSFRGTCEYDASLAGIPAYQLGNWTSAQGSVRITGMGWNISACNNELFSCLYSGVTRLIQETSNPITSAPPTHKPTTLLPSNYPNPDHKRYSYDPALLIIMILGASSMLALLAALFYRRWTNNRNMANENEPLINKHSQELIAPKIMAHSKTFTPPEAETSETYQHTSENDGFSKTHIG
jgi:hypothetical protein